MSWWLSPSAISNPVNKNIPINRREFLKLAGLLSAYAIPHFFSNPGVARQNLKGENVLIVVFDAFSASNISLSGYGRLTTPHINRLAEKAIVYHNHFAGANFTTPGTASLLTGVLPWTHRAFKLNDPVTEAYGNKSIFHAIPDYHRFAYTHNPYANTLLRQFFAGSDGLTPRRNLFLESDFLPSVLFENDEDIASVSWEQALRSRPDGFSYSLYLSQLYEIMKEKDLKQISQNFPLGLPSQDNGNYFILEQGIDYLMKQLQTAPQPFLGYYHFLPPHEPYNTRADYYGKFAGDEYHPVHKPKHFFNSGRTEEELSALRLHYDEFILYVDSEFARLYDFMERQGLLENTWLVLTSDHGEMFERGVSGHIHWLLHQPVIHIPLLIFAPGQSKRTDVFNLTSAVDILPTMAHLTDHDVPSWGEGTILPPFSTPPAQREVFSLKVSGFNEKRQITKGTAVSAQGSYKLMYFFGYNALGEQGEMLELYNLDIDPEELNNLYPAEREVADQPKKILKAKIAQSNQPYS